MLVGTASIEALLKLQATATIDRYLPDAVQFDDVACFQMTAEMHNAAREAILPPSLHPTIPAALSLQVWSVGAGTWGAFRFAFMRAACRSGVRARGFSLAAFASGDAACAAMRNHFGFPTRVADVTLRHGYDGVDARVTLNGADVLHVQALDPEPMDVNDVQYTGTLNLAYTPNGVRLVQLEADHTATRVERLTARLLRFDAAPWGNALLDPYNVVSSSLARETIVVPPLRFVCKADELAFTGTETIAYGARA